MRQTLAILSSYLQYLPHARTHKGVKESDLSICQFVSPVKIFETVSIDRDELPTVNRAHKAHYLGSAQSIALNNSDGTTNHQQASSYNEQHGVGSLLIGLLMLHYSQ